LIILGLSINLSNSLSLAAFVVYVHKGKSYLNKQIWNGQSFIANGTVKGTHGANNYPDHTVFDCVVEYIKEYTPQQSVVDHLVLRDEFIGVSKFAEKVSGTREYMKDFLEKHSAYYRVENLIPPPVETDLDIHIRNWDTPPTLPADIKPLLPFIWSVDNKLFYPGYPCSIDARSVLRRLIPRAVAITIKNPSQFTDVRHAIAGDSINFDCRRKGLPGNRETSIDFSKYWIERELPNGIKGNNLEDIEKNIDAFITLKLKALTDPLMISTIASHSL